MISCKTPLNIQIHSHRARDSGLAAEKDMMMYWYLTVNAAVEDIFMNMNHLLRNVAHQPKDTV